MMNPALGLILGWVGEFIRAAIVRRLIPETKQHMTPYVEIDVCRAHPRPLLGV
jgi:hypothetical protein